MRALFAAIRGLGTKTVIPLVERYKFHTPILVIVVSLYSGIQTLGLSTNVQIFLDI